jgi:hypothetical protein
MYNVICRNRQKEILVEKQFNSFREVVYFASKYDCRNDSIIIEIKWIENKIHKELWKIYILGIL